MSTHSGLKNQTTLYTEEFVQDNRFKHNNKDTNIQKHLRNTFKNVEYFYQLLIALFYPYY